MAVSVNSRPARNASPIVVRRTSQASAQEFVHLLSAGIISTLLNGGLIMLMFVLSSPIVGNTNLTPKDLTDSLPQVSTDKQAKKEEAPPPLSLDDVNPNVIVDS